LLSDFLDRDYETVFKRTGRRHDLIAVRLSDPGEEEIPPVGLLEIEDAETGKRLLLDTSSRKVRDDFRRRAMERRAALQQLTRAAAVDLIEVSTDGSHLDALIRFFRQRERRLKGH
jgi:uncharacterized protein (DUF58 family)